MPPSVARVSAVPVAPDLSLVPVVPDMPVAPVVPVVPVVPVPVVASYGRWVVEFKLPGVVLSRAAVLGV